MEQPLTQQQIQGIIFEAIKSGSNSNGYWLMFADGTLVCWATRTSTSGNYATWTFPVAFVANPTVLGTSNGGEGNGVYCTIGTISTTSCRFGLIVGTTGLYWASAQPTALLAIGKWK